jgi:hypothetical protein
VAGLVVTVGVITAFTVQNSSVQQQLIAWQQNRPTTTQELTQPGQLLEEDNKPTLAGSWPLIIVWSLIGLVTYSVAASIAHSIATAANLKKSLDYVHAKRHSILEITAERIALRLVAGIILGLLLSLFISRIIPYSISASHASAGDFFSSTGWLYALLSFAVITFSVHVQTIFLRLALGKLRLFSTY